jgi:glycine/D-amino acid oxidase-like deaminating enzyme
MRNGDVSFWFRDIGGLPARRPPLRGDADVDVCIVGAGFTGLWTAYYLKRAAPDLSVAVLEKEFAGFGASGRNGGWCAGEFPWRRDRYLESGDRDSLAAFETAAHAAVDEVLRVCAAEGIDADLHRTDCLTYACTPAQWQRLREQHAQATDRGAAATQLSLVDAAEARARIRIRNAMGALVLHGVARVQPAKLVRGLAEAVERLGVAIHEGTEVTAIAPRRVHTRQGVVRAGYVLRATEGFTHGIAGQEREVLPLNSALIVTEPVPDALWAEIGWAGGELMADASHVYCYAQRTRGNRIAIGGRGVPYRFGSRTDIAGRTQPATVAQLRRILARLLPQAAGLRIDHAWCGVLGVPRDWCATVGLDPATGIGWAGGYVGVGVSTSNLAGRTLADLVLGRQTALTRLPWVNRRPPRWEPEPLRWLGVQGMYGLYRLADRMEARGAGTSPLARLADRLTGR